MTTPFKSCLSLILPLAAALTICTSCIYDAPGDRFYRTLWTTTDADPLGPVTLEFLCGDQVSVTSPSALGSLGYYECDGTRAWFTDLTLTNGPEAIKLTEAERNGDILHLTWTDKAGNTLNTSTLHRLSEYRKP